LTAAGEQGWLGSDKWKEYHPPRDSALEVRLPVWWGGSRELYLGDDLVKRVAARAKLAIPVLDACQDSGWARLIKSPYAGNGKKRVQMLTHALRTQNAEQRPWRLAFEAEKGSVYFGWKVL
jgi:hypothetical protein